MKLLVQDVVANSYSFVEVSNILGFLSNIYKELDARVNIFTLCSRRALLNNVQFELSVFVIKQLPIKMKQCILSNSLANGDFEKIFRELRKIFKLLLLPTSVIGKMIKVLNKNNGWLCLVDIFEDKAESRLLLLLREILFSAVKSYIDVFTLIHLFENGYVRRNSASIMDDFPDKSCFVVLQKILALDQFTEEYLDLTWELEIKIEHLLNIQKRLVDPVFLPTIVEYSEHILSIFKTLKEINSLGSKESSGFRKCGSIMSFSSEVGLDSPSSLCSIGRSRSSYQR